MSLMSLTAVELGRKIKEKEIVFSDKAKEELKVFEKIIQDILNLSVTVFLEEDSEQAREIEPMEEVVERYCPAFPLPLPGCRHIPALSHTAPLRRRCSSGKRKMYDGCRTCVK